jgi:hypothetical protein
MSDSIFKRLSNVDISGLVKPKGNFWYLSWSNAVREASKLYPDMNWEFTKWDDLPFLQTPVGYFVECSVTIGGITRTQMLPVLDHKNQTLKQPDAAAINKSQMRALTKAIALHGLGLDLWAGEDLGDLEEDGSRKLPNYRGFNQDKQRMIDAIANGQAPEQIIAQLEQSFTLTDKIKTKIGELSDVTQ